MRTRNLEGWGNERLETLRVGELGDRKP